MKKATKGLLRGVKRSLSVTCNIRCGHSGGNAEGLPYMPPTRPLWPSDRGKIFVGRSELPIYIVAPTTDGNPPQKSLKTTQS